MTTSRRRALQYGGIVINLLVIIAVLALLAAILLPSLCRSSEQANRIKCASNLRALGQAIATYQNENGGHVPRTLAEVGENPTPVFYTGANARNPFAPDGPQPNDVTAAIYLLLRTQDVTGEVLLCPSSANERTTRKLQETSNFANADALSYSYQNPYGRSLIPATPATQPLSGPADSALLADINPGGRHLLTTHDDARRVEITQVNSPNHAGDGQNVLYADGHVDWCATPFAGSPRRVAGKGFRDNIYLGGGPGTAFPAAILAAPADALDTILLPVSPTGPASGAMAVQRVSGVREVVWLWAGIAAAIGVLAAILIVRTNRRRRRHEPASGK